MVGSRFEGPNKHPRRVNFKLFPEDTYFTDDTVLTVAVADSILNKRDYSVTIREYYRKYPYAGYGKAFKEWGKSESPSGYNSYGNGSAMRVSPIAYAFTTKDRVMEEAMKSAIVTHDHPEGVKGAQAIAYATFLAINGASKRDIKSAMENELGYDLVNLKKGFDSSCMGSVPHAIVAFLNSDSFIDAIRKAVLMGGDSDTIACMAGSIAQPYYGAKLTAITPYVLKNTFLKLPDSMADILIQFINTYVDADFTKPSNMTKKAKMYDLFREMFKS